MEDVRADDAAGQAVRPGTPPVVDPWAPPSERWAPPPSERWAPPPPSGLAPPPAGWPPAPPPGPPGWAPSPPPYVGHGYPGPPPPPYELHRPRRTPQGRSFWAILLAALVILGVDVAVVADRRGDTGLPRSVAVERRLVTESEAEARRRADRRDSAIDAIFERRAQAILTRDLDAFLADIDPEQTEYVAHQREVFTSLGKLDFSHWSYQRNDDSYSAGGIDFARYGEVRDIWLPVLILRYRLKGFDVAPVGRRVVYTMVQRGSRWYIGSDTDLDKTTSSGTSVRVDPWENGPIVVERSPHGIVIGHPEDAKAIGEIKREVEDAVRHVTSFVGRKSWARKVVVVLPTDEDELNRILENPTTFFEFAAVARSLTTMARDGEREDFAGSRVVINPEGFDADDDFTTHLIRHEVTHVAMFDRTGPLSPNWLVEGVAEYVGNAGSDLPPEVLAGTLARSVTRDGPPRTLPTDSGFGLIGDAGIGYDASWLLCRYIASHWSEAKLFKLHDVMGTVSGLSRPGRKLPAALRSVLGVTEEQLVAGYQKYVVAAVGDLPKMLVKPGPGYQEDVRSRLPVEDIAKQKGISKAELKSARIERAAGGIWDDGPEKAPRRRVVTTVFVSADERGARTTETMLRDRLRPYDGAGIAIPNGRLYYVGTTIGGRHYNETIGIVRTGTVVIEVRVAVPGSGDSSGETRRIVAAQYAAFA